MPIKLYTKTGDDGSTGLTDGARIGKDTPRVEACGAVDALNSTIGWAAAACDNPQLDAVLTTVQNRLFELGADLMTPPTQQRASTVGRIGSNHVVEAERQIDALTDRLTPLARFILPGGGELAARLHMARTACRLAERRVVALSRCEPLEGFMVIYLNRLSDLLFAAARFANQSAGVEDVTWVPPASENR